MKRPFKMCLSSIFPLELDITIIKLTMIKSLLSLAFVASTAATPLDDYVWAPDAAYGWTDMNHIITGTNLFRNRSWTGYTLNMVMHRLI